MKRIKKISGVWVLLALMISNYGCKSVDNPKDIAKQLIQDYKSGNFEESSELFLPQVVAYATARELGFPKGILKKSVVESDVAYRSRIASFLESKKAELRIDWDEIKFERIEKILVKDDYRKPLQVVTLIAVFKGKINFKLPITLAKYNHKLYLWDVGAFDRYR